MIKYYRSCLEQSKGIKIDSLTITSPPTKTIYKKGDTIDTTGLVVTAKAGTLTGDVTSHCAITPQVLDTEGTQDVSIYYGGKTTSFQATAVPSSLEEASWETIQTIGRLGIGSQYWSVGDSKTLPAMSGAIGNYFNFSDFAGRSTQLKVFIIHFNYMNQNGIYFGCFRYKNSNDEWVEVILSDKKWDANVINEKTFNINHWGINNKSFNYGGWKGCDLRYDILGSTDVAPSGYGNPNTIGRVGYDATETCATNPVPNTLMSKFPIELREVMKPIEIYTDNSSDETHTEDTVTMSIDFLPLMAEYEMWGSNVQANSYEKNYQQRFGFFLNGYKRNWRVSYNGVVNTGGRMSRSLVKSSKYSWCSINSGGSASNSYDIRKSFGLSPFFRVA
jgi:hypothetical protein